ncbi:MAG: hypothetical protein K9L68_00785 [Spirochaetales bacterium]|nr:hypothetical protein [Spirochaetales bacterium]MCF7937110.1 hypothetical protein [Spirochaetales bacterium]
MKKVLLIVVLLMVVVSMDMFAAKQFGVGGSFSLDALGGLPQQAMVTFTTRDIPVVLGAGLQLGGNQFNLGMTADWWLYHRHLVGILDLYVGPGLYAAVPDPLELGGRVPVGFQIWPLSDSFFELFLEVAPTLLFISNREGISIPNFGLQGAFGFRFWF